MPIEVARCGPSRAWLVRCIASICWWWHFETVFSSTSEEAIEAPRSQDFPFAVRHGCECCQSIVQVGIIEHVKPCLSVPWRCRQSIQSLDGLSSNDHRLRPRPWDRLRRRLGSRTLAKLGRRYPSRWLDGNVYDTQQALEYWSAFRRKMRQDGERQRLVINFPRRFAWALRLPMQPFVNTLFRLS